MFYFLSIIPVVLHLNRLSQLMGNRLTDNNADIADLSDANRPTKLAEQYSELYDNQWTEAFIWLTEYSKLRDRDAVNLLLHALSVLLTTLFKIVPSHRLGQLSTYANHSVNSKKSNFMFI